MINKSALTALFSQQHSCLRRWWSLNSTILSSTNYKYAFSQTMLVNMLTAFQINRISLRRTKLRMKISSPSLTGSHTHSQTATCINSQFAFYLVIFHSSSSLKLLLLEPIWNFSHIYNCDSWWHLWNTTRLCIFCFIISYKNLITIV